MSSITEFTLDDVQKFGGATRSSSGGEGDGYASAADFVNSVGGALTSKESGGKQLRPDGTPVTSKKGAIGLWQVMPDTAPEAARLAGVAFDDIKYRTDANYNAKLGRAYLAKQYEDFQDPAKALAAYNAGPGAVNRAVATAEKQGNPEGWLNYLPAETRNYVPAIMAKVSGVASTQQGGKAQGEYYTPSSTNYATYKDPGPGATFGDYIKEVAASAVDSVGSIGQAAGEAAAYVANKATGTEQYEGKNLLKPASGAIRDTMTEGGKRARQDSGIEGSVLDLFTGEAKMPKSVDGWIMVGANGFGSLITMIAPEIALAGRVGEATTAANAAMKASQAAEAAGDAALAAQKAQEAAKFLKQADSASATLKTVGGGLNAAMTGGAAAEDVRQSAAKAVSGMSHEQLMANVPVYAEAYKRTGDEQQSRDAVVNSAARWAGAGAALVGAAGGAFNAKVIEDTIVHKGLSTMIGNSAKSITGRALIGGAGGAAVEGLQETGEKVGQNMGENLALGRSATDNALRDTAGDFMGGVMVGHPTGSIAGAMAQPGVNQPVIPPALQPVAQSAADGGILSRAAMAGNAGNIAAATAATAAAAQDPIGARVAAVEQDIQANGLLDKIRGFGPETSNEFLYALNVARNPNTPPEMRQRAIDQVEHVLETAKSGTGFVMQPNTPKQPGTAVAVRPTNAVAPNGMGQFFDPNTIDGEFTRVDNMLPGPRALTGPTTTPAQNGPQASSTPTAATPEQQTTPKAPTATPEAQQTVVTPTEASVPQVEIPAGAGPAERRKRGAELREMAKNGFETVERDGDKFYMVNSKTNQRLTLRGPADAQMARKAIQDHVDELAHTAASSPNNDRSEPTEGQIKAGNYKKSDVIDLNGMKIKIENPRGSVRRGTSPDGVMWETNMAHHYGEFQGTVGADGDKLDVFVGPRADSKKIYVIDQVNEDGSFDEHKVMMGFTSEADARAGYLANYEKGWTGLGAITEMSPEQFREWAKSRAAKKPLALNQNQGQAGKPLEKAVAAEQKSERANFATLGEAKAYIAAQRRGNSNISALPYPNEDGTFGIAIKGTPGYAKAEKFARDQQKQTKKAKSKASPGDTFTIKDGGKSIELKRLKKGDLPKNSLPMDGRRRRLTQDDLTALQAVAAVLGKEVVVFSTEDAGLADGFVMQGNNDTIYINQVTTVNPMAVFGHEVFHTIRETNPKAWDAIAAVVEANMGPEAAARMTRRGYSQEQHLEELTSDLAGDLFADATFWTDVFAKIEQDNGADAKGIIAKLIAYLNNLVAKLVVGINQPGFNSAPIVKDFNAVRAAYRDGLSAFLKDAALTQQALQAQITREEQALKKSKPVDGEQPTTGYHFSKALRQQLLGEMFGTGLRGAERARLEEASDARLKSRVSFYVDEGKGLVPEAGVGGYAHEIKLPKLYNAGVNAEGLFRGGDAEQLNASESRVLNAGYDGYWVPNHSNEQGVGVILGKAAKSVEAKPASPLVRTPGSRVESGGMAKGLMSRELEDIDVNNIPGAKLRGGTLTVPVESRTQANAELSRIGSVIRFSKPVGEDITEEQKQYNDVVAQYKGTDKWMKAPNGEPTQLSERQWVQVRTPNFKKWFGDWEKAAANGGVWGEMHGQVSIAVDKNGEPLVVYHGTNKGGFSEFKTPGGEKRGDMGIFTTPNLAMAQTYYSKRGGEISLEDTSTLSGLLNAGFDIYDDVDFAELYEPDGTYIGRFDSKKEAEDYLVDQYAGTSVASEEKAGYYAMFINMRNPIEADFEGAMWNGERPGQYIVTKLFEQQYDDDGRGYFDSEEEAQAFADKINGYVEEAPQDGQSTDSVVREAHQYNNDGAAIFNVVDSGPGWSSYIDEPSDVYVALDPSQLKSANYNDGGFSVTSDDLRYSKPIAEADAEVRQYKLDIEREQRAVGKAARLSADEVAALASDGAKLGLTKAQINSVADDARRIKKQFPESEDWAPLTVSGIQLKTDDEGNPVPGSEKPKFQAIQYGFNVPPGMKKAPAKIDEAWLNKVATKFESLVLDIYDRAEKGDKNAQIIIGHQTWYRNVAAVLRREYGGAGDLLADLLGATSPNTPVDTNWKFSLDVMRRFMAGDFNEQLAKFSDFVEKGGNPAKYPSADKIRQISGKLYGMNSVNAMKALVDMWRVIEPGSAPKARNFALNLIGQSNMATIDVWAARMLRRAADMVRGANLPRIPPPAEDAVTGNWNADATRVTGGFGFGAEVMDKVAAGLAKRGIEVTPPDLQAIAWFAEKELWGQKGWTTKAGEGGSFEENIEATPVERYIAGWSIQQGERVPSEDKASEVQARVVSMLIGDDSVVAARVMPTSGLYGGDAEASFDTEWTAMKGRHDPSMVMAEIAKIAQENKQLDIFVSKVVGPKEVNANARPGVEVYFRTARDLEAAKPVLEKFTAQGQDGFTMVVDPRATPKGVAGEQFIGVRLQYVPEIAMRFDPALRESLQKDGAIEALLEEKRKLLNDIAADVMTMDGVAFAAMQNYDTVVVGKENYSDYIDRIVEGGDQPSAGQAWFGTPLRQAIEGAAARLGGNFGQDSTGGVPDAGRAIVATRPVGDGSGRQGAGSDASGALEGSERAVSQEALKPLPGAPEVKGFTGPDPRLVAVAEKYAKDNGIDFRRQASYVEVDEDRAKRIAAAYEAMPHAPQDPKVKAAYKNLIKQTVAQYKALTDAGYKFWFMDMALPSNQEYASTPWNAMRDIRANKEMGVFPTADGFGTNENFDPAENPLLEDTGFMWPVGGPDGDRLAPVLANDLFRAVHDAFGHGLEGAGFRARGEENAWQAHRRLFTGSAVGAITSETRGQNSWLNYGPHGEKNRTAKVEETVFADQKTGLMPSWTWEEGVDGDFPGGGGKIRKSKPISERFPDTPEFKRWFGDSKTVTASGKPIVFYRGQSAAFNNSPLKGRYFTSDPAYASTYDHDDDVNVLPVYIKAEKIYQPEKVSDVTDDNFDEARLIAEGYDAIATKDMSIIVPLKSDDQIKSATGNNGEFSDSPDITKSLPVPEFYSQLERSIADLPERLSTMAAPAWKQWIKGNAPKLGVKAEEIEWSGINDYLDLKGKEKIGKADLVAYLKESGVKVKTVAISDEDANYKIEESDNEYTDYPFVVYQDGEEVDRFKYEWEAEDFIADQEDAIAAPQYGKYTLPGGKNYREVLITLPAMSHGDIERMMYLEAKRRRMSQPSQWVFDDDAEGKELKALQAKYKEDTFQSSHFLSEKNIVAHIRANDRTDSEGNKILFIEEVQSDWGQMGKKRGFNVPKGQLPEGFTVKEETGSNGRVSWVVRDTTGEAVGFGDTRDEAVAETPRKGLPLAPFVTKTEGWLNLALKRIAMMAVEGGYDKVAFVTGMQSADRYDLSKQIESIGYDPKAQRLEAYDKNRNQVMNQGGISAEQLEDYVGKEVAKRLLEQPLVMGKHLLDGENIKVGGEGMIKFYDEIVPQAMSKLLPKLGGDKLAPVRLLDGGKFTIIDSKSGKEVGRYDTLDEANSFMKQAKSAQARGAEMWFDANDLQHKLNSARLEQPGFDVTDKMRETIGAGVPLFSRPVEEEGKAINKLHDPKEEEAALEGFQDYFGEKRGEDEYSDYKWTVDRLIERGGKVYRLVFANSPEEVATDKLGWHWTADPSNIANYERSIGAYYGRGENPYVIEAVVPPNSISNESVDIAGNPEEQEVNIVANLDKAKFSLWTYEHKFLGKKLFDIDEAKLSRPWFDDIGEMSIHNGYKLSDLFKSPNKLSWWDKTVGTMYNLAQKHPEFKRVYDAVQRFINDVSYYATRSADLAPTILPKLESWRDITKSPLSAEDVKALAGPVFQGTLSFGRDENGELMPEDDPQKAGVVFSDDELRDFWQLDDRQIALYREFRASVDKSIADLAVSDVLRYLGDDGEGVRQRAMSAQSMATAEREIMAHLDLLIEQNPGRSEVLTNTKDAVEKKFEQANNLMDRGYAPLSRFGEYTVYVVGQNGEQLYFSMFESKAEANKMAREMRDQYPDAEVTTGTMSQESYKLFSGITPETLSLFGEALGLEEIEDPTRTEAYQEMLKVAKSNRSAMKRLIQRKGIEGYSEDVGRVLAGFVYSNARQVSTNLHAGEIAKSANEVKEGDVKDAAIRLTQYIQNPQNEAQAIRGLLFANFIGGSIASAMVNLTQPFTMTMPYLSQFAGLTGAAKRMAEAVKLASKAELDDDELARALKFAEDEGIVSPQEVHQLMGQAAGKGALQSGDGTKLGDAAAKLNNTMAKVSLAWGKLFSSAEQFNRRVTFIAAYKLARDQGMADPMAFAEKTIAETQGVYNKGNKPEWARGAVGSTLFTFKQYSIGYVEFIKRMYGNGPEGKKAVAMALGVLFLMSGLGGMPGADDLDDVIDGFAQRVLNKSFSSKQAKREFFAKYLGEGGADFVMQGISSLPGVPVDISGRMGLGNLVPGTGFLVKKQDHAADYKEFGGPAGTFVTNVGNAAAAVAQGEFAKAAETLAPVAAQNVVKAFDMANMGYYRDYKGRKVIDTTLTEAILKGAGFQPSNVSRIQQATREQQGLIALNKIRETEIADLWAAGRIERDQSKIDRAKQELADWNKENPESPIKIDAGQINKRVQQANMEKAKRLTATAPKEIRASVKRELERATD